jgi:hypothetical protein
MNDDAGAMAMPRPTTVDVVVISIGKIGLSAALPATESVRLEKQQQLAAALRLASRGGAALRCASAPAIVKQTASWRPKPASPTPSVNICSSTLYGTRQRRRLRGTLVLFWVLGFARPYERIRRKWVGEPAANVLISYRKR